jgi:hypothetical protein
MSEYPTRQTRRDQGVCQTPATQEEETGRPADEIAAKVMSR